MALELADPYYGLNPNAIISINNTTYYIQDDWFETVRKFFKVTSDDEENISFLKSSLFGFNTEIFSNEIKNNVWHRNIIYEEHFLNTASFPESIYNFAKTFNYDIDFAKPSHCRINFACRKEELISNKFKEIVTNEVGSVSSNRITYKLVLSNDFIFLLDNKQFRLPYPVVITFKETADKTDFTLNAYYDTSDSDFPYLVLTNDYIKMWQEVVEGQKMVYFGLDLFQLTKKEDSKHIISEDISDNLYYEFDFRDQLAYFEVFYEYGNERTKLETYFNNTFQPDTNEKYCFYSVTDTNKLQISFSATGGSFRPALNSMIYVNLYTTIGSKGNFKYVGNKISVNFSNDNQFDKMFVSVIPITDCSGGNDEPTYTQAKQGIIEKFSVRNNLIIDNDLDVFFTKVNNQESVNGSNIQWIKKRNDVLKRVYNAYLTLRNKEGKIIPTNTAPTLLVSDNYFKNHNFCIRENSSVLFDKNKNQFFLEDDLNLNFDNREKIIEIDWVIKGSSINKANNHLLIDGSLADNNISQDLLMNLIDFCNTTSENYLRVLFDGDNNYYGITINNSNMIDINLHNSVYKTLTDIPKKFTIFKISKDYSNYLKYRFPFLLEVQTNPILVGNYFNTYTNSAIIMNFAYINPHIEDNFSLKEVLIQKDNIQSTKYTISLDMNTTFNRIEQDKLIIRCLFKDSLDQPYGFIDLLPQKLDGETYLNKFYFEGYLEVNQDLLLENNKLIINQLYSHKGSAIPQDIINNIPIEPKMNFEIAILIKSDETNYKHGLFNQMEDLDEFTTALIYVSEDNIELYQNLYHCMESDVRTPNEMRKKLGSSEYTKLYGNNNYYHLKQIPLVEEEYFENVNNEFFEIFETYINIVTDSAEYFENNTAADVKLVNTFGKSNWFYSDYTKNSDGKIVYNFIDNINLDVMLNIYCNYYMTDEIDIAIKQFISDFIESCNDGRLFPISNLITALESNFDIIKYIEFFNIANTDTQKIKSRFTTVLDLTKEELEDYVPEYLNVTKKLDFSRKRYKETVDAVGNIISIEDTEYNKSLVYPYQYNITLSYIYK